MTEQRRNPNQDSKGKGATQRNKNKSRKPAPPKTAEKFTPVNLYVSACCGANGTKKPLVREATVKPNDRTTYGEGHLGVFRCSNCKKHSTFTVRKNKDNEVFAV